MRSVNADGLSGLHSLSRRVDQRVGRRDDVAGGSVVVD